MRTLLKTQLLHFEETASATHLFIPGEPSPPLALTFSKDTAEKSLHPIIPNVMLSSLGFTSDLLQNLMPPPYGSP